MKKQEAKNLADRQNSAAHKAGILDRKLTSAKKHIYPQVKLIHPITNEPMEKAAGNRQNERKRGLISCEALSLR
ncbi:hypothetical protein [Cellvibrio mixtus]|uniref:hypothetical protein n=1 Tax=Cellvibrio mixtus TaxID=39650 RepID=UPI00058712CB|nr:hypothetical protein [Cellvibrio mixtus]